MDTADVLAAFVALGVAIGPISILVTKMVDFARNLLDASATYPKAVWNAAAFVIGVVVCVGWGYNVFAPFVDLVPALRDSTALDGLAGQVLTGLATGAMAGGWHERFAKNAAIARAQSPRELSTLEEVRVDERI